MKFTKITLFSLIFIGNFALNSTIMPMERTISSKWNDARWNNNTPITIQTTKYSTTTQWLPKGTDPSKASWSTSSTESSESPWVQNNDKNKKIVK